MTAIKGMSCSGLSIISKKLKTVFISIVSKVTSLLSEITGILYSLNTCSNIGAVFFVERRRITISPYSTFWHFSWFSSLHTVYQTSPNF